MEVRKAVDSLVELGSIEVELVQISWKPSGAQAPPYISHAQPVFSLSKAEIIDSIYLKVICWW